MYQSELCKAHNRGRVVAWEIWFIGVGISLAYCKFLPYSSIGPGPLTADPGIDYGFSHMTGSVAWRTPIAIQLVFAIIVTVLVWGLPESPRWLAKRGREEEAIEALCAVHDLQPTDPYIQGEIEAIRAAIAIESGSKKMSALFKSDILQTRRRVILAWFGLFMNQWSGINLGEFYPLQLMCNRG